MQIQWSGRERYRPSGRLDWMRFLPWALLTALVSLLIGAGLNWLYSAGWYVLPVPIITGLFAGALVLLAISRGKCRSPAIGTLFGFLVGVLLYGGYLYFGMVTMLGPQAATRLDLLPKYISLRVRTDTSRDLNESSRTFVAPDPLMNTFRYGFEALWILTFTTAAGYRRSRRSYCEQCGKWKHQDVAFFPPGNGNTIAGWLNEGKLDSLAEVPPYVPRGRSRQSTMVALERCQPPRPGCAFYLAVKDATTASGMGRFDGAFGRVRVPRVEITPDEVAALAPVFPGAEPPVAAIAVSPSVAIGESTGTRTPFVEVVPIPADEAHRVLTPLHIAIANLLAVSILPLFFGGIVGCFVGLHFVTQQMDPRHGNPVAVLHWLVFTGVSAVVATLSGFIGLRNSSFIGDLYYRFLSRRSIARRPEKWVDPKSRRQLPTFFVQVVPRHNWGTMKLETATDTGFLQIDAASNEIRFEGDLNRYRIPIAAITDLSIASYSTTANLKYSLVVLQGLTPSGPWEAPLSLRQTKPFVGKDHRQRSAQILHDQIAAVLPVAQPSPEGVGRYSATCAAGGAAQLPSPEGEGRYSATCAAGGAAQLPRPQPPVLPGYAHSRPTDLKPRATWGLTLVWRLALVLAIVGFGMWRGANLAQQRRVQQNRLAQLMSAQQREPGPTAPRLPLNIKNSYFNQHLTVTAPYYQPGGDWTVLQCATSDNSAGFTVAIEPAPPIAAQFPTAFQFKNANVALLPADRNLGANLVAQLATAFNQPLPAAPAPQPLITTKFSAQVLGDNLGDPHLGLQAGKGSWTAQLWPIEQDGLGGQIYFNYNVYTRSAELVSGGAESDGDAVEGIALAIRDGPQPARSEQNDPTFTSQGPAVVDLTSIPQIKDTPAEFSSTGNLLIYYDSKAPATIRALDLNDHRRQFTIARLDGRVHFLLSADHDDNHFLVFESLKPAELELSRQPEIRIWWIDRSGGTRRELKGPWGSSGNPLGQHSISPDDKYCAIYGLSGTILDANRSSSLYLVNLQTGNSVKADDDHLAYGYWQGTGPDLRYTASKSEPGPGNGTPVNGVAVDPQTGHCSPTQSPARPDETVSPNGQLIFHLDARKSLTITPANGGPSRVLNFSPRDRRFATDGNFQWLSPRYLAFTATKECFIDVQQMKVGYLPTPPTALPTDEDEDGYQFAHNFKWALAYTPSGLMFGRVVLPENAR